MIAPRRQHANSDERARRLPAMTAPRAFEFREPADRPAPWDPVVEWDAIRVGLVGLRDVLEQLAALEDAT